MNDTTAPKQNQNNEQSHSFIRYLIDSYGSAANMIQSVMLFISSFKSKKLDKKLSFIMKAVTIILFISDFFFKVKDYIKQKGSNAWKDKNRKIANIFGSTDGNINYYNWDLIHFGRDVIEWILSNPKTSEFKIIAYYNMDDVSKLDKIELIHQGKIGVHIVKGNDNFMLVTTFLKIGESISVGDTEYYAGIHITHSNTVEMHQKIMYEYTKSFDIKGKVIIYDQYLIMRPRSKTNIQMDQVDVDKLAKLVLYTLKNGQKKGISIIGPPGTGKSTLIHILEKIITDYPFIYISPSFFKHEIYIKHMMDFIKTMQPCIPVFEDIDSCGIEEKNDILGAFLSYIDGSKFNLNAFMIASINNSNIVHPSVVRTGRLGDEIIEMDRPKTRKEINNVAIQHYSLLTNHEHFNLDIPSSSYRSMLYNKFVQSDICEVINRIVIDNGNFTKKNWKDEIECIVKSKKALKKYNNPSKH